MKHLRIVFAVAICVVAIATTYNNDDSAVAVVPEQDFVSASLPLEAQPEVLLEEGVGGFKFEKTIKFSSRSIKLKLGFQGGLTLFKIGNTKVKLKAGMEMWFQANTKTCKLNGGYKGSIDAKIGSRSIPLLEGPDFSVTNSRLKLYKCKDVGEEELQFMEEDNELALQKSNDEMALGLDDQMVLVQEAAEGRRRKSSDKKSSDKKSDDRRRRRKKSSGVEACMSLRLTNLGGCKFNKYRLQVKLNVATPYGSKGSGWQTLIKKLKIG